MEPIWRLLIHPPLPGDLNMAVDWWLLRNCEDPVLRIYSWDEPTLSLGYRQQFDPPENLEEELDEFTSVLRPTGGGYLYHGNEITYSVAIPRNHELSNQSITDSYRRIESCFESALKSIDLLPESTSHGTFDDLTENCLSEAAEHEPTVAGRKWMASSQTRHLGKFLQHGSLFWKSNPWPEEDRFPPPHFLSEDREQNQDSDKRKTIQALIRQVDDHLFPARHSRPFRLGEEWKSVQNLREHFLVNGIGDLPMFRRHSEGLLPCGDDP